MREIGAWPFLVLLAVAAVSGLVIAFMYLQLFADRATGSHVYRAFSLIALSMAAIFIAVQFSLPLSVGLLGALSLVRFRTPVKEPEEVGFIMLVVAAAVAVATVKLMFLAIVTCAAVAAAAAARTRLLASRTSGEDGVVRISVPARTLAAETDTIRGILAGRRLVRMDSVATKGERAVITLGFTGLSRVEVAALENALRASPSERLLEVAVSRASLA
jgi:hypothetical protein